MTLTPPHDRERCYCPLCQPGPPITLERNANVINGELFILKGVFQDEAGNWRVIARSINDPTHESTLYLGSWDSY